MSTIIAMTWKEMLRKRVVLLTIITTLIFLIAYWFLARSLGMEFVDSDAGPGSMEDGINQYIGGAVILLAGFFFSSFVVAFLAIFSSVAVIAGEAEQGVMQALLPRPLTRIQFFVGRWIGFSSLGAVYTLVLFIAMLAVTEYHASVPGSLLSLIQAFLLFVSIVPLLVSLAMLGSCYLSAMANGVVMTMLYGAGWLGGMLNKLSEMGFPAKTAETLSKIGGTIDIIMPTDALQRRMFAELFSLQEIQPLVDLSNIDLGPFAIASVPSNTFLWYVLAYWLLLMLMGIRAFRKKDL